MRQTFSVAILVSLAVRAQAAPAKSGGTPSDAAVDAILADMTEYGVQAAPLVVAFDGDCVAQGKRMLSLEPIAKKIKTETAPFESDPATRAAFHAKLDAKQADVMATYRDRLATLGVAEADVNAKSKAMNKRCHDDPAFQDAMSHVGLWKRKI